MNTLSVRAEGGSLAEPALHDATITGIQWNNSLIEIRFHTASARLVTLYFHGVFGFQASGFSMTNIVFDATLLDITELPIERVRELCLLSTRDEAIRFLEAKALGSKAFRISPTLGAEIDLVCASVTWD